ncbi:hypothetical protein LTR95_009958 [Oleoguttula sp. CCFEE 5521]
MARGGVKYSVLLSSIPFRITALFTLSTSLNAVVAAAKSRKYNIKPPHDLEVFLTPSSQKNATTDPNADDFRCLTSFRAYDSSYSSYAFKVLTSYIKVATLQKLLRTPTTSIVTSTVTYKPPVTLTYQRGTYTGVPPTCTIAETACTPILSSYSSAISDAETNGAPYPTNLPHCETSNTATITSAPTPVETYVDCAIDTQYCFMHGGQFGTLFYWPVTTVNGDFCAQNGTTVTPSPTDPAGAPNTVVSLGYTFTSPTPYISLAYIQAYIHGRRPSITPCGPQTAQHTNFILPLNTPLTSARSISIDPTYSFNLADLNSPIPTSAWDGQRRCRLDDHCATIEGDFTVFMPLPTEVVALESAWVAASCKGTGSGWNLTPVPLGTATASAPAKITGH